jgi:two-component system, cell cycle response regulator DivK
LMRRDDNGAKTVLLVEDFADSRFMMRSLLEMDGYRVVEAANGREAVEFAKRECPDLILMDLSLPEMDGLEATKLIRQLEGLCDTPIIALTAHDAEQFHSVAMEAGCTEYVTKPVDFDLLEVVVGRFCPVTQAANRL